MSVRYGTIEQRFEAQYIPEPNSGCWIWFGPSDEFGYGRFRQGASKIRGHRLSYELANGSIPNGTNVLHRCDMSCCVNPDHLWLGTTADNNADRDSKGRTAWGTKLHSKLTEQQVHEIRDRAGTQREIAKLYGVSHNIIGRIKRGEKWANLPKITK